MTTKAKRKREIRESAVSYPVTTNPKYLLDGDVTIYVNGKELGTYDVPKDSQTTGVEMILLAIQTALMQPNKQFGPVTRISLFKP